MVGLVAHMIVSAMNPDGARPHHRQLQVNGIELHVAELGDGPPVILCHGFPELGYSWRHQLPALAAAGYRAIAPDLRGYGQSSMPADVESYDVLSLCQDMLGLLDDLGEERAVFIGHDWGANLVWQLALAHPGRVSAVVGMSVPFVPRAPAPPVGLLRKALGEDFYIVWFQQTGVADAALLYDVRRTLSTRKVWGPRGAAKPSASARLRASSGLPVLARATGQRDRSVSRSASRGASSRVNELALPPLYQGPPRVAASASFARRFMRAKNAAD